MRLVFLFLRTLWTLPTTAVGLLLALLALPFGTRWQIRHGTLECYGGPVAWLLAHTPFLVGGAWAMTLGDVILGQTPAALDVVRVHEQVHVRQAHRWGPFFLPAYLLASLWIKLRGGDPYRGNPFEIEAYSISDARRERKNPHDV